MDTNYSIRYVSDEGWRKTLNQKAPLTGTPLIEKSIFDIFELCKCLPDDGKKGEHGAIFTYNKETVGKASTEYYDSLMTGGVVFVDIDHIPSTLVDDIFDKFDDINFECNSAIIGCQKSSSYYRRPGTDDTGVHFFLASRPCNGHDYVKFSSYALALVALAIKKVLGVDVREYDRRKENADNVDKVLDTSSCKISQRSFLYHSDYRYNETVIPITDGTYDLNSSTLKNEYPELFKFERCSSQDLISVDLTGVNVTAGENLGRIQLDYSKECIIANYLSATGMEPDKVLTIMLKIDSRDNAAYMKKHGLSLENHFRQIIQTSRGRNISEAGKRMAEDMLEVCGVDILGGNVQEKITSGAITSTASNKYDEYEQTHLEKIELGDGKFMSDYVDKIEDYILSTQVLAIKAGTGTGKTTLLKSIAEKYSHKALIVTPYNATNQLYEWSNIVSASNGNEFEPERWNTMIWDQVLKHYNEIERSVDIIFVDESHEVFFEWWRDSSVGFMQFLKEWKNAGKKIVLISATPAGEVYSLGANVIEFTREEKRNVKVNIIKTNDTFSEMNMDMRDNFYDKVCIFSDRDVQSLYARAVVSEMSDVKIYHMKWWKHNVEELKHREVLSSKVSLLTRVAFNGLNIRNTGERILVDVRYTEGITTWNEIIQIVGRFRDNKNVTLNIYNDGKFKKEENREDEFSNAKTICEGGNAELVSDYQIRMNKKEVQDACKCVDEYKSTWSLEDIKKKLEENGWQVREKEKSMDDKWVVKKKNPLKKQASDLMLSHRAGEMTRGEFMKSCVGTEMENYVKEWENDLRELEMVSEKIVEVALMECKKQNTLISTAIDKIKRIKMVTSMTDDMWGEEVEARKGVLEGLKGNDMVKHAMHVFKMHDTIREKYKDIIGVNWSVGEHVDYTVDPFDVMFEIVSKEVEQSKVVKSECQKGKHGKFHKQHKLYMYKCVETGESKTSDEWIQVLGCNLNRFNYLVRKKLYIKTK